MDNFDYQAYLKNNPLLKEDARTDAEQEGYKDGFDDAKADIKNSLSKMKVSELKQLIREEIQNVMEVTPKDNKRILQQLLQVAKDSNLGPDAIAYLEGEIAKFEPSGIDPNDDQDMLRNLGWNA